MWPFIQYTITPYSELAPQKIMLKLDLQEQWDAYP